MERGKKFEAKVEKLLSGLQARYDTLVQVSPQFPVQLTSGRKVVIDFKLTVEFPHEVQSYYFELQSRNKHDHALSDKVEAIRRDTPLSTFTFVHETPLEESVITELVSRNIIPKDWPAMVRFVEGIELLLLQQTSADRIAKGRKAHDKSTESRLKELVSRLANSQTEKDHREFAGSEPTHEQKRLVEDIVEEVARNPDEAIREARRFFGI
jgi:hypothetical protein